MEQVLKCRHIYFLILFLSEVSMPRAQSLIRRNRMEKIVTLMIPLLFAVTLVRMLLLPLRLLTKLLLHSAFGFACLWLLNSLTPFTGIAIPVTALTVLVSGILGLPGIGLLALLAVL